MSCRECGCMIPYYIKSVDKIENYQDKINELYEGNFFATTSIRRLKIKRDKLLKEILWMLEGIEGWLRKDLFDCRGLLPIYRNGERKEGQEYAEATDWEYDEVSSDED